MFDFLPGFMSGELGGLNPFEAAGGALGPLPSTLPAPPLPEQVAGFLGNQNVTPQQFLQNPMAFAPKPMGAEPSLGGALEPNVPLPQARPAEAGPGAAAQAAAPGTSLGDRLGQALKGVKSPAAPDVVKPSTPSASVPGPRGNIRGGNIAALLAMLSGAAPQTAKVPMPLNTGGRY